MLTPEDQTECMSYLPKFDIVHDRSDSDTTPPTPRLVDGFFEKNSALQEDMRAFQVLFDRELKLTIQSDLSEGQYQSSYLQRAASARGMRLKGDFDKWKVRLSCFLVLIIGRSV